MLECELKLPGVGRQPFETAMPIERDTREFISREAFDLLSRAAKRTVSRQQRTIMRSLTPRKMVTARIESRRLPCRRSLVSAPAKLRPIVPKIIIEEASVEDNREATLSRAADTPPEPELQFFHSARDVPATAPEQSRRGDGEAIWEEHKVTVNRAHSPPGYPHRLTKPRYQTPTKPRSQRTPVRPATTDWDWVRSKLLSRDSIKRPESAMTFDDFIDELSPDSDEYDTDLEDAYFSIEEEPHDPTGIWYYHRICEQKNISPVRNVTRNLDKKNIQFRLNHRCMNAKDTAALAEGLRHSEYVQDLDLSNNGIDDEGAKHLADFVKENTQLYRLDVGGNCMGCAAGRYFAQVVLHNRHLTTLCLRDNRLGDKEALLLAEVLRVNKSLRSLDVSHNDFGDEAGEAFGAMLMDNKSLKSLNLSWNNLRKRGATGLATGLDINATLLALDLSWNGLGDEGAALLGHGLKENSTLRFLSLAVNHICGYGAEQLANGISGGITISRRKKVRREKMGKTKCALQHLILDRNPLGAIAIKVLLSLLSKDKKLKTLSIKEVLLNKELLKQVQLLSKTLNKGSTLLYEGQNFSEQTVISLCRSIHFLNNTLQLINVDLLQVINALDPTRMGVNTIDLRNVLAEHVPLAELEIEYAVRDLDINNDQIIQYNDIAAHCRRFAENSSNVR